MEEGQIENPLEGSEFQESTPQKDINEDREIPYIAEVPSDEDIKNKNYSVPENVTNPEAYFKYIRLRQEFDMDKNRYRKTSDPGLIIDLATTITILMKKVRHLPKVEQDELVSAITPWRQRIREIGIVKAEAFGQLKTTKESSEFNELTVKQAELIEYFGKFYTVKEVHKIIAKEWGYDISLYEVKEFYRQNLDKIVELQKEFESSHEHVRLGKRRSRLEELSFIYSKLKDKFMRGEDSVTLANTMKSLLESIKKEVDGDLVINGKMKVEIEQSINLQIYNDIMKDFNMTQLIISRLAGRLNINPLFLLSRLANSNYAKFTGFAKPDVSREEDKIDYPSQITYDFDRIQQLYQKRTEEDEQDKALPVVHTPVQNMSLKDMLLQKLAEKREIVEASQNLIIRESGSKSIDRA